MQSRAIKQATSTLPGHHHRGRLAGSLAVSAMLALAAIGPARAIVPAVHAAGTSTCAGSDSVAKGTTISIAYSSTQEFNANAQAAEWFQMLKKAFEQAHPGVILKLIPIGGSHTDFENKVALMLRSPSTTPDIVHEWTQDVTGQVTANQLAPLDDCVAAWPDWKLFPPAVQTSGAPGPHIWQMNSGVNNFGLYYNVNQFKQAGLPTTWQPHNWNDILAAARTIKAKVTGTIPLWLFAGNQVPDAVARENFLNLLQGTRSPITVGPKWVVKSTGLLDVFNFYHTVFSEGLGPSQAVLNDPQADGTLTGNLLPKQKVAIALVGSWAGSWWIPGGPAPWPGGIKAYKATPIPTEFGQAPHYVTQLSGSTFVMTAAAAHKKLAFDLLTLAENHKFNVLHAWWCGEVPPRTDVGADPTWVNSTPYFNAQAAAWVKYGQFTPSLNYTTIENALAQSTGEILANGTSGQQALTDFTRRVSLILDPSAITTAP